MYFVSGMLTFRNETPPPPLHPSLYITRNLFGHAAPLPPALLRNAPPAQKKMAAFPVCRERHVVEQDMDFLESSWNAQLLPMQRKTCTDKKGNQIFLIYKEIQSGAVAKSYMRKVFLIYEEMRKYFTIYEEAVSLIYDFATAPL
jgi:hypothetical protein